MKKDKEKWCRLRHRIATVLLKPLVAAFVWWKTRVKADRFREQGKDAYFVLYNHQTPYDQFFVAMSFRGPVYYIATEDLFSNGFISSVLRWVFAPIPFKKSTMDLGSIKTMVQVAKEGGTMAIAPEGNRTYSGKTETMSPAIARLAQLSGLPIALYRIEGGYGVEPRWSDRPRRGKLHAYVSRVIRPEEYKKMSKQELFEVIRDELSVNEAESREKYRSNRKAEYLERLVYICPYCGLSEFESSGDEIICKKCGRKIRYREDKQLEGVGFEFPFRYVNDWYEYQNRFVNGLNLLEPSEEPYFRDAARVSEVIVYKRKAALRENASLSLYGDRIVLDEGKDDEWSIPFDEVTAAAALGHNKLNIYHKDRIYQFKGGKRFNAVKYVQFYYRYYNLKQGDQHGEFLGF